jgi:hypothetical protein
LTPPAREVGRRKPVSSLDTGFRWYQPWYRTERREVISADLSVPGVTQDEPTERLQGIS